MAGENEKSVNQASSDQTPSQRIEYYQTLNMACLDALEERVEALENEMSAVERCIKALVKGDSKITEMLDLIGPALFKPTSSTEESTLDESVDPVDVTVARSPEMPDSKIKALPQSITTPENQPTRKGKGHAPKARSDSSIARQRFMAEVALDAANSLRFLAVDRSMNDYNPILPPRVCPEELPECFRKEGRSG